MLSKIKEGIFSPFKKISLTFKITLWYTIFIVILIGSIILGIFLVRDSFVENTSKKNLIREVNGISSSENFKPYEEGIILSIYDENGNLIAGSVPRGFNVQEFSLGAISEYRDSNNNKYMYYDIEDNTSRLGNGKYVRGVVQTADGEISWYWPFIVIAGCTIIILIIMYGGYMIIKNSLRPVREMTKTAEMISNSGDLSKRIEIKEGKDEVHTLALVFNKMLDSLEHSSKRERQFSSDVSHELRTPISVIMAESEYGVKHVDNVDEAKESFEVMERQSKRMTMMINQILEMARLDSHLDIPRENINLSEKLTNTLEDYKKLFESKNIKLDFYIEENINLLGNEALLIRLVDNLLSNALKYATTEVCVKLAKRNSVILEVADDGIGISDEEKKHIWDRFYKVDKSRTTTEDNSSGLGLSITRKIVELHNGKIAVLDNKPKGTKFIVNF